MGSAASGRPEAKLFRLRKDRGQRSRLDAVSRTGRVWHARRPFTQKEIVCVRTRSSDLEDLHHVEELAMDVADDRHGRSNMHDIALLHKQLLRLGAYCLDDRLSQELFLRQPRYALVEVYGSCAGSAYVGCVSGPSSHTRKTRHGGSCRVRRAGGGGIDNKLRVSRPR